MAFKDTHAAVFTEGYEGDAGAELMASYDEDSSLSAAAIGELTSANDALIASAVANDAAYTSEVNRLKAVNYDLLTQVGASSDTADVDEVDVDAPGDADTFDDLFTSLETA